MSRARRSLFALVAALVLLTLMAPISQRIEAESSDATAPATDQPVDVVVEPATGVDQAAIESDDAPAEVAADVPPADETTTEEPVDAPTEIVMEAPTDGPAEELPSEEPADVPTEAAPSDEPAEQPADVATEEPIEAATATPTEEAKVAAQEAATGSLIVNMGACVQLGEATGELGSVSNRPGSQRIASGCDWSDGVTDGVVHIDDLPPATYWVSGYSPSSSISNYGYDRVTIAAGQATTISMSWKNATLTVRLADATSGAQISSIRFDIVQIFADGAEMAISPYRIGQVPDNAITINPGTYRIVTNQANGNPTYPATSIAPFTLGVSEARTIDLTLKGGAPASRAPECWAEKWSNPDNGYKLDCDYYVPGETVNIYLDHTNTKPIASFVANYKGSGTVWVSLKNAVGGQHKIVWQGSQTTKKLTKPIDVPQIVTLSVDRGISGTIVTIYGSGFGRNEQVTIYWTPWNSDDTITLKTVTSRRNGDVVVKIKIPKGEPKQALNSINLIAPSGNGISAGFEIIPRPKKSTVSRVTAAIKDINIPGI